MDGTPGALWMRWKPALGLALPWLQAVQPVSCEGSLWVNGLRGNATFRVQLLRTTYR